MIEKPFAGRAIIEQNVHGFNIEIPSRKNWFLIIFLPVWLCGWILAGTSVIGSLLTYDTPVFANAFLLFWLMGWAIFSILIAYLLFWQLVGREKISIERGILKIDRSVFGVGVKKYYEIKSIYNLAVNPEPDMGIWNTNNLDIYGAKRGKIKFDYGLKTVKFAGDVDEAEARMIVSDLRNTSFLSNENFA
jgi:hypothetical protein